jgi:hypothetical protein
MHILTLAIGVDYRKSLKKALESKRLYAERHGYTYIEGGEEFWDRHRPIAWSKIGFLLWHLKKLPEDALVWLSDADVLITNPNLTIEDHVLPLLPENKDLLFIEDACHNLNSGNVLMRNSKWLRSFWEAVNLRIDCTYHIWWENMAMIKELKENELTRQKIQITKQHKRFNAYLKGNQYEPLWEPNDFLVHFAGVYNPERMESLIEAILNGKIPRI